jgi:hypothetical protein
MNSATIVQKLWDYCNSLRDNGMSYGDYVDLLAYRCITYTHARLLFGRIHQQRVYSCT